MRNLKIIFVFIFLCACSAKEVKETQSPAPEPPPQAEPPRKVQPVVEEKVEKVEKPKAVVAQTSIYDSLNEAVRSQNDEKIYQASTQILSQNSTDAKAMNALAMYHYKKGHIEAAYFLLQKGIALYPKSNEMHSNLGLILLAKNERREAVKEFRAALQISSTDPVASANLGAIYAQERDYTKAQIVLENAYNKGLRDPRILNNYALSLMANKKYDKAEDIFKAALKDQNNDKDILLNYAILLIDHQKKYPEGLDIINRLKFVGTGPESRNRINALEIKAKAGVK